MLSSSPSGYDVPVLSQYLDWIAVMTYDYHGQWDKKTGHVSPMYGHPDDDNPAFNTVYILTFDLQGVSAKPEVIYFVLSIIRVKFFVHRGFNSRHARCFKI